MTATTSGWNFDMSQAPRDGTLLQLLIKRDGPIDCCAGFDDANPSRAMGFNNYANDGEDVWRFPGWDWCQDVIVEQGCGLPVAFALMLPLPEGAP